MGFVQKIFKKFSPLGIIGGLMGGKPKAVAPPTRAAVLPATEDKKSPADIAADEEEQRRKRLLALNATGGNGQLTPAGGDQSTANVTRKQLLGQ
jgi:hypothetical protein